MKTILKTIFVAAAVLVAQQSVAQWGNKRIKGDGNIVTKTINTGDYDNVKVVGSMDVHLESGNEGNITIETDSNIIDAVVIEESGGTLKIKMKKGVSYKSKHGVHITVPFESLEAVSLTGSGDVDSKDVLKGSNLSVSVTGSGDLVLPVSMSSVEVSVTGSGDIGLSGDTQDLEVQVTGSGDFSGFDLQSQNTEVSVSGSGDARVVAKDNLVARVHGSGDIEYKGNPNKRDTKTSGSGDITSVY